MKLYGDFHTHTIYSSGKRNSKHASGTILENAIVAKDKGFSHLVITDHGLNHKFFGVQEKNLKQICKEIEEAKAKTGIKILLGIEANLISCKGHIDVLEYQKEYFDFVVCGFHKMVKAKSCRDFFKLFLLNILGIKTKKQKERNTVALCDAMRKNNINIISHPKVGFDVDLERVCEVAKQTNTMLEINGKRIAYSKEDVQTLKDSNIVLAINSDAHSSRNVGRCQRPISFLIKNKISPKQVFNMNKINIKDYNN